MRGVVVDHTFCYLIFFLIALTVKRFPVGSGMGWFPSPVRLVPNRLLGSVVRLFIQDLLWVLMLLVWMLRSSSQLMVWACRGRVGGEVC